MRVFFPHHAPFNQSPTPFPNFDGTVLGHRTTMPSSPSPNEQRRDHDDYEMTMTKLGVGCHLTKYNNQNSGQSVSRRGGREKGRGRGDVERLCGTMTTPSSPSPDERQQDHGDDEMTMMRLGVGGSPGLLVGRWEEEDEVFRSVSTSNNDFEGRRRTTTYLQCRGSIFNTTINMPTATVTGNVLLLLLLCHIHCLIIIS
jgi:hypothetical protein